MQRPKIDTDALKSALVATTGTLLKSLPGQNFDTRLGELLHDVQRNRVYGDGKIFVDLVPSKRLSSIREEYKLLKKDPNFDLRDFVSRHFYDATESFYQQNYVSKPDHSPEQHIDELWTVLERRNRVARGSLLALPYKYIVPGGRFNEMFYWDTYFIMLGLAASDKWRPIDDMMKNFTHQLRKYGYIPTANRSYLLSRSQPPFFSHMVRLLQKHKGKKVLREYLPYLIMEYRFWMRGKTKLSIAEHKAYRRLVEMPDGSHLNRYYDNKTTPRPESLNEDIETAELSGRRDSSRLFLHIRAAAESGWDFSSRWFLEPSDIKTIHTCDIVPVDLNCLLYHLEITLADAYEQTLNLLMARQLRKKAKLRARAIQEYMWDEKAGFYMDYNFHNGNHTSVQSLAGIFPLYVGIATKEQAEKVAEMLRSNFLKPNGLATTNVNNGQQWDSPNGWAPLQWVTIEGLRNYGHHDLANEIVSRWLGINDKVYTASGKFIEKYNVNDGDGLGGGGEYSLQDGFGWTNGVYMALKKSFRP